MDVALGHAIRKVINFHNMEVLILVVMDVALGLQQLQLKVPN